MGVRLPCWVIDHHRSAGEGLPRTLTRASSVMCPVEKGDKRLAPFVSPPYTEYLTWNRYVPFACTYVIIIHYPLLKTLDVSTVRGRKGN